MFDLIKKDSFALISRDKEYQLMAKELQQNLPMIRDACSHFGKNQSQFMDNFLTISHPTPLRNCRQILAEMNKLLEAMNEAYYSISKKKIKIKKLQKKLISKKDSLDKEEIELEIYHETASINTTMLYVEGALRAITNYREQYTQILNNAGYSDISEIDFETEEEKYHIMKAFEQALCAARSRGGIIDEGNHIYFSQLGVNGAMAQNFISKYLDMEQQALKNNSIIDAKFQQGFLKEMADYFKGCSEKVAEYKGQALKTEKALLKAQSSFNK